METSIILKSIEKGSAKQLNASKNRLYKALEVVTVKNLSFNISVLVSYYDALIPELNKRYDIEKQPESNADKKALLLKLFKQNSPVICEQTGRIVKAEITEQNDTYTDYVYNERSEFSLKQVYNIILSARKKAPEIVKTGVTYRKYKNVVILPAEAPAEAPAEKKKRERKPKKQAAWFFNH